MIVYDCSLHLKDMPQPKGKTGNPNGRPKGSINKSTQKIRLAYAKLLEDNLTQMQKDLKAIEKPETRLKLLIDMSKFVVPALSSVNVDASEEAKSVFEDTFKKLAEEE